MLLLSEKSIVAHELRDFSEWHQGIRHYGFWCLLIDDPPWQRVIASAQAQMAPFLHPGYERQPHVTLFSCGLLTDDFFSGEMLTRQVKALTEARLTPVGLGLLRLTLPGHLDSFATAPHLPVADPNGGLAKIRACLAAISREDSPPASYHPHITLGFYRQSFAIDQVAAQLRAFRSPPMPWTAPCLSFCRFVTAATQGPLEALAHLPMATTGDGMVSQAK